MILSQLGMMLALVAVEPAGSAPERLSTPPLPPGVGCGPMRRLELADVHLTPETRLAEVVGAWGEPAAEGPAGEIAQFWLNCDSRLWLSFAPDGQRRLKRAILFTGSFVPSATVIFDDLEITGMRRCDQLPLGRRISAERLGPVWGPPDNQIGSGIVRWTYTMADGSTAQVFPDDYRHPGQVTVGCSHEARRTLPER